MMLDGMLLELLKLLFLSAAIQLTSSGITSDVQHSSSFNYSVAGQSTVKTTRIKDIGNTSLTTTRPNSKTSTSTITSTKMINTLIVLTPTLSLQTRQTEIKSTNTLAVVGKTVVSTLSKTSKLTMDITPSSAYLMPSATSSLNMTGKNKDETDDAARQASVILVAYILPGCILFGIICYFIFKVDSMRTKRKMKRALFPKPDSVSNKSVLKNKYADVSV